MSAESYRVIPLAWWAWLIPSLILAEMVRRIAQHVLGGASSPPEAPNRVVPSRGLSFVMRQRSLSTERLAAQSHWRNVRRTLHFSFAIRRALLARPRDSRPARPPSCGKTVQAAVASKTIVPKYLARGQYGTVHVSADKAHVYKFIAHHPLEPPGAERRLAAQALPPHPHIVGLEDVTDAMAAGDGCEVLKMPFYLEGMTGQALPPATTHAQLLDAIHHLWGHGWAMADVKPENLRLLSKERGATAVLIDLDCVQHGIGYRVGELQDQLADRVTAGWVAPEAVEFLLRDDRAALLGVEEVKAVLARQATWGAGMVRLHLEGDTTRLQELRRREDPPVPPANGGGGGEATTVPAHWLQTHGGAATAKSLAEHVWFDLLRVDILSLLALNRDAEAGDFGARLPRQQLLALPEVTSAEVRLLVGSCATLAPHQSSMAAAVPAAPTASASPSGPAPLTLPLRPTIRELRDTCERRYQRALDQMGPDKQQALRAAHARFDDGFRRRRSGELLFDEQPTGWKLDSRNKLELRLRRACMQALAPSSPRGGPDEDWQRDAFSPSRGVAQLEGAKPPLHRVGWRS